MSAPSDPMPETRRGRFFDWLRDLGPTLSLYAGGAALLWTLIAAYFISVDNGVRVDAGMMWLVAAGLALLMALLTRPIWPGDALLIVPVPQSSARVRTRTYWLPTIAGTALLALLAEINGNIFEVEQLQAVSYHDQFALLIVGVVLLAWGLRGGRVDAEADTAKIDWKATLIHALPLIAILLVALVMRFFMLESAARLFIDEVHFANPVQHFNDAPDVGLLIPFSSVAAFPYLYPYWQWMGSEAFGYTLVGLRAASAIFGVLGVWAVYLLGRELFDRKTALLAALLLATFPPHIHFSRMGLNNIADPFFGTLALVFLARGLRSPGWRDLRGNFALAGVMLGLTQYFYEGGRLLFSPLAVAWLLGLIALAYVLVSVRLLDLDGGARSAMLGRVLRADYRNFVVACVALVVATVIVGAPVYYTLFAEEKSALTRLETAGVGGDERFIVIDDGEDLRQHIGKQFQRSVLLHTSQPESALYYAGDRPMIHPLVLPAFLLGFLWCCIRIYTHGGASLLIGWVLLAVMGNTLMQDSRIVARYVVSFPAMMLMAALGLRTAARLLFPYQQPLHDRGRVLLMSGLVIALAVFQANYYFNAHLPRFSEQFRERLVLDSHDVLFRAAQMPTDTDVFMIGEHRMGQRDAQQYLRFLNRGMDIYTYLPEEFTPIIAAEINPAPDKAFFVDPDDVETLLRLQAFYPQMDGPHYSPFDLPQSQQFVLYRVAEEG